MKLQKTHDKGTIENEQKYIRHYDIEPDEYASGLAGWHAHTSVKDTIEFLPVWLTRKAELKNLRRKWLYAESPTDIEQKIKILHSMLETGVTGVWDEYEISDFVNTCRWTLKAAKSINYKLPKADYDFLAEHAYQVL